MTTFDIREEDNSEITEIVFAEREDIDGDFQAYTICPAAGCNGFITIYDGEDTESVSVSSVEHAENLIKALRKAIELGWVK